jgi:hypothetical protein
MELEEFLHFGALVLRVAQKAPVFHVSWLFIVLYAGRYFVWELSRQLSGPTLNCLGRKPFWCGGISNTYMNTKIISLVNGKVEVFESLLVCTERTYLYRSFQNRRLQQYQETIHLDHHPGLWWSKPPSQTCFW